MTGGPLVLRDDDPRLPALLGDGWTVQHRSWGARLTDVDVTALESLTAVPGYRTEEARADSDSAVALLEDAVRADYPGGPATAPAPHDVDALAALRNGGTRCFAAFHPVDGLVAVTAIRRDGAHAETDFTAVARAHRRRGLAEAVKSVSVLALLGEGVTVFGTGGAEENAASLAMNARLGSVVTERWLTLVRTDGT